METWSSFSSSGLGESKKSGLERDDCRQTQTTKEEEKEKHRYFCCTRTFLVSFSKQQYFKSGLFVPLLFLFLHLIFKARLLAKHSRNKIRLRVELNINLQLCTAWYHKMKAVSCRRQDAECCAMGMPALSPRWLCRGFAQSRSHPAALQRFQLCQCTVLALQGCLVHGLLVKARKEKVLYIPWSFSHSDRGRKTFLLLFYISVLMTTVNFESILFFWVLLV